MSLVQAILSFMAQQDQMSLAKEEWKLKKQQLEMAIEERDKRVQMINSLPKELQPLAIIHPQGASDILKMNYYINQIAGVGKQQFVPETDIEPGTWQNMPTGKYLPVKTQPQGGLPQTIAQQSLFGGLTQDQLMGGILQKELGVTNPTERVTREMRFFPDKGWFMADVNKFGQPLQGTEGPLPPNYKEVERDIPGIGRVKAIMDMNTAQVLPNSIMPMAQEVTRERTIGGPTGVQNIPVPKLTMPGQTAPSFPEPTKMEMRTEELPSGAQRPVPYNPYGPWVTPGQAIPGPGTKTVESTGGLSKQPEMMLPIKMDDVTKWIHPKTLAHPQPGISPQQATKEGFKLVTTQAATDLENIKNMEQPVKELGTLMPKVFGPESEAKKGSWAGEKAAGWQRYFEGLLQTNVDAADYKRFADSTLSIWARGISAEKGNLNEGDVKRASGLIGDLTSRPEIAWRSYRRLQGLIKAIKERKINGTYDDSPTPLPGEEKGSVPKTAEEYMNKWR